MQKLFWLTATALAATLGLSDRAAAQKDVGPALEVRVRSVDDLIGKAEYLGEIVNQPEAAKQAAAFVRGLTDEKKGIEGVDPARPFGLYGSVTSNVIDSPVVLMVPIADERAFLDLLTSKLSLDPKKGDDGAYQVKVPNVPVPVFFRFANKTAYVTLQSAKGIEAGKLIDPKDFFAGTDDAIASVRVHLDRVPDDVKKTVIGQFELKVADVKEQKQEDESPAQRKLRLWALDRLTGAVQSVLTDGNEMAVRLLIDPKGDDLTAELTFTTKSGSELAKFLRGLGGQSAKAATLAGAKSPVAAVGLRLSLPEQVRKDLAPVIDALIAEAIDKAKEFDRQAAKMALDAAAPTLKSGELDAGLVVTEDGGKLGLVAALGVVQGGGIEKTVKQFAPFAPEDKAKFEFDVRKAGGLSLHKVVAPNPDLKATFGTETVWLGTSDTLLAVSIEPKGKALEAAASRLAEGSTARGPVSAEVSVARVLAAVEKQLPAEKVKELTGEVFPGGATGKDTATLTVDGGDALKVRITLKGKAVKLAVLEDQEKKK
jgi:hypothetical protein